MSNLLTNAWTIAKMKSVPEMKRNPILILILLLFTGGIPLTFVYMFGGTANLGGALVGAFVSSAPALALFASAQDINFDNYTKLRQIFVSKPISPMSYVLGASLSALIFSLPGIVLFGALLLQRGLFSPMTAILSFAVMLFGWVVVSSAGFTLSGYLINASPYKMNSIINLLAFGMIYLPPVYYPATALGSISWLAALIPVSAAAEIVRSLAGLAPMDGLTWLSSAILLIQGALFTLVFVSRSRWREI
jgi:ABC-2 type transport system permease protein